MHLIHYKSLLPPQDATAKVTALVWSQNGLKLAIATADRVVSLYDEKGEKRDKFATKPLDPNASKRSYIVKGLGFSPDGSKLAVGQTDNAVFVYKIGENWGEKKVICNKFVQQTAVTALVWPRDCSFFIFGLVDGKVRVANLRTNKASTLYSAETYVVSLRQSYAGSGVISGHADGSIVCYLVDSTGGGVQQGAVIRHSCTPSDICWGATVVTCGPDRKLVSYEKNGTILQMFDYSNDTNDQEITCLVCSPGGRTLIAGSFDRLRLYSWNAENCLWEEAICMDIPNMYDITAMGWRQDGTKIALGLLSGAVEVMDFCLKKTMYKNKFEMTYVDSSQVIIKDLSSASSVVMLKSQLNKEIKNISIMGNDRYLVAFTSSTLLLSDLDTNRLSEVMWISTPGEKFFFEHENVCLIFSAGELILVEYGFNEILCQVKTEIRNPHLLSVRINEKTTTKQEACKRMAYLLDIKTILVVDLVTSNTLTTFAHDTRIDWLELNKPGTKLLFRDTKLKLHLLDLMTQERITLLPYCTYVQWVPLSDVAVAQSKDSLYVWYNISCPTKTTVIPIKGDITGLERFKGKTEVLVNEGGSVTSYLLNEELIEFGSAMEDGDLGRAAVFLESVEVTPEVEMMWRALALESLKLKNVLIAERCYAALKDVPKVYFLKRTREEAEEHARRFGVEPADTCILRARLAILEGNLKLAESIYIEDGQLEAALAMYINLQKWEEALELAETRNHPDLESLQIQYYQWLMDTGQRDKAGQMREQLGQYTEAVRVYLQAGFPAKAARLCLSKPDLQRNPELLEEIASALIHVGGFETAADLFERLGKKQAALDCHRKACSFRRAVELARTHFPAEVVKLEEAWGDHLLAEKHYDSAITHFIESGQGFKAAQAAILAKQWGKALQIVEYQDDASMTPHMEVLAKHYASVKDYQKAERLMLKCGLVQDAAEMYRSVGRFEDALRLSGSFMQEEEVRSLYIRQAGEMQANQKLLEAEKIYILIGEPDLAIDMYKKLKMYDQMVRLVSEHHQDLMKDTYIYLAKEMEADGLFKQSEHYFCLAEEWKDAVNMYRSRDMWEDAHRVAKAFGGLPASKQVAYLWAKSLGGESAVSLLKKLDLLEEAIDFAASVGAFDFGFELAKTGMPSKLGAIHLKYAMYLEDEGHFKQAEEEFLKAGKPREAVLMYVYSKDWDSAQRLAESHDPESIADVLVGQAQVAFSKGNHSSAESFLLRAQRPDLAIKLYKENDMWESVLRLAEEYLPNKLPELKAEYQLVHPDQATNLEQLLHKAKQFQSSGEYAKALECYLQIEPQSTMSKEELETAWTKAAEMCVKFTPTRVQDVLPILAERFLSIQSYRKASEVYHAAGLQKDALDALISGEEWKLAKTYVSGPAPRYEKYFEEKYKASLVENKRVNKLMGVDASSALDLLVQQGQWEKCLTLAKKSGEDMFSRYLLMYAADCIKSGDLAQALQLVVTKLTRHLPQNFAFYQHLAEGIFSLPSRNAEEDYKLYSQLRDLFFQMHEEWSKASELEKMVGNLKRFLLIAHQYCVKTSCTGLKALADIESKVCVSLLRFSDVVPCDRAYYDAGMACKSTGSERTALVLLNHFLDLSEAIEEADGSSVDSSDLEVTDFPLEVPLPKKPTVHMDLREAAKEWVLSMSMNQSVHSGLPLDSRGVFEASLVDPQSRSTAQACILTGYPVLKGRLAFKHHGVCTKEDWNKYVVTAKTSQSQMCKDVLRFICTWCGTPQG